MPPDLRRLHVDTSLYMDIHQAYEKTLFSASVRNITLYISGLITMSLPSLWDNLYFRLLIRTQMKGWGHSSPLLHGLSYLTPSKSLILTKRRGHSIPLGGKCNFPTNSFFNNSFPAPEASNVLYADRFTVFVPCCLDYASGSLTIQCPSNFFNSPSCDVSLIFGVALCVWYTTIYLLVH